MIFMAIWRNWNISTKRYAIVKASIPGRKMGMVFTKSIWTRWRAFGHYCVVGYVHTGEFRRSTCRIISAFLNSHTTQEREVKFYPKACYRDFFHHPASQHEPCLFSALRQNRLLDSHSGHMILWMNWLRITSDFGRTIGSWPTACVRTGQPEKLDKSATKD